MLIADQLPTLVDPAHLFGRLALWAGAPAAAVGIVVWLLTIYSSAKSWFGLGTAVRRTPGAARRTFLVVQGNVRGRTTVQQRAMVRLFFYSIFTVAFSYILAEIIYVVVQMVEVDPTETFSVNSLRTTAVAVTPWPPPVVLMVVLEVVGIGLLGVAFIADLPRLQKRVTFLGGVARAIAWTGAVVLGFGTVGGLLAPFIASNQGPSADVPMSFVVTTAVAAALCLGLALSLPRLREASEMTFKVRPRVGYFAS